MKTLMKVLLFPLQLNINIMISNIPQEEKILGKMQIYSSPKEEEKSNLVSFV